MTKICLMAVFSVLIFGSCVDYRKEPLLTPLSISGKIDCARRYLTSVNPNEYVITLYDSQIVPLKTTQPSADGKYFFEDLESGMTYSIRVNRTSTNPPTFTVNQVKNYLQQTPIPSLTDLARVAADVDKSGEIDATDVLHVDRYLRGITPSMPGGIWRIFPSYLIDHNNNFLDFNTPSPLNNLLESVNNFDFIMVQLGDVSLNNCN